MKKIMGALQDLPANQHSQSSPIHSIMAGLAVLVCWQILWGSHDFLHTFSMALYHKWDVKSGFNFVHKFFMLISDGLGGVRRLVHFEPQSCSHSAYGYALSVNFHLMLLHSSLQLGTGRKKMLGLKKILLKYFEIQKG